MIVLHDDKLFDKIVEIAHIKIETPFQEISLKYEGGNDILIQTDPSSCFHPAYSDIPNWIIRKLYKASQKNKGDIHFAINRSVPIEVNSSKEETPIKTDILDITNPPSSPFLEKIKNPFLEKGSVKTSGTYLEFMAKYGEPIVRYNEDSKYYREQKDNILLHKTRKEMHEYFHNTIQMYNLFVDGIEQLKKEGNEVDDMNPLEDILIPHFKIFWDDLSRMISLIKSFKEKDYDDEKKRKIFENAAYYKFFCYIYLPQFTNLVKKL